LDAVAYPDQKMSCFEEIVAQFSREALFHGPGFQVSLVLVMERPRRRDLQAMPRSGSCDGLVRYHFSSVQCFVYILDSFRGGIMGESCSLWSLH
jgi:hypothetical protein